MNKKNNNQFLLATLNSKYIHSNVAIRLLYSLYKDNYHIEWKEFTIKESIEKIAEQCLHYDVIAFSCYIWNIIPTLKLIKALKKEKPEIKILLGGPEVSYEWESLMDENPVDYIITGEGEIPFGEFLNQFPSVQSISNLVWRNGESYSYKPAPSEFPLQNYSDTLIYSFENPETLKDRVLYMETSRGCPYKCEFCLASLDNKVRYLPTKTIHQNLLYMMEHGKVIKFLDRTFNMKKEFTLEVFDFILKNHKPGNVFQFEITADILHPDIIQFINEKAPKNLFRFEIGIQTVNQKANLEVQRKQNFEKTKSIIKAVENKVELHLDLIVGLALDYYDDVKHSFEEVFKLFAPELQLGFLKFLKGTPLKEKHKSHGFVFDPLPPYQIIESNYLNRTELKKIQLLEHVLEIYWNKKRAIHSLRYVSTQYSIFTFLIELGLFFESKHDLHHYSLEDVYKTLFEFVKEKYCDDRILNNLITIDYFLHFKVKPKDLFKVEAEKSLRNRIIQEKKLNHHLYRFIVLSMPIHPNSILDYSYEPSKSDEIIVIQYDGTSKAKLIIN
jgi:radical SAM superfamily enzyme YgiQ (UPF0313 family)